MVRSCEIPLIVTARLEKYRQQTEAWLARYGVRCRDLVMGPWVTKEDRAEEYDAGRFKGRAFRDSPATVFVESCPAQASAIAKVSGKRVICPASRHLHMALCGPPQRGRWICGPNPGGYWDHHIVTVPAEWPHYRRVLVVRNPMTRLVGLWLHYAWAAQKPDIHMPCRDLTWPQFVLACAEDEAGRLSWLYRWTITRLIEPVDRLDGTIRYERLSEDLRAWVGDVALDRPNHAPVDLSEWYGDARICDMAAAWGQSDRLRFGY